MRILWCAVSLGVIPMFAFAQPVGAEPEPTRAIPIALRYQQQWCAAPPNFCILDPSLGFDFHDEGDLTYAISLRAEEVDGKIVYKVSGTATNQTDGPRSLLLTGRQFVSFAVPRTFSGGAPLPTTLVISSVAAGPSELPDGSPGLDRVMTFSTPELPPGIVSEALGQNQLLHLNELYIRLYEPRNVKLDTLIAGDSILMGLTPRYTLTVTGRGTFSFDDTITYELRFAGNPRRR